MNAAQSSPSPLSEPVRTAVRLLLVGVLLLTVALVGVISGFLAYGLIGIFLGPTLMAIAYTLLLAWLKEAEPVDAPVGSE